MGGSECALAYHYEWSDLGNRHHGNANVAINLWRFLTLAGGLGTEAAFSSKAKNSLGSDLKGVFGTAINYRLMPVLVRQFYDRIIFKPKKLVRGYGALGYKLSPIHF